MEKLSIFLLTVWHFAFFWRFYRNPNLLATSEVLSTFFPHWRWMGLQLRSGTLPLIDKIYYKYPACIPFLSTFYPPSMITSLTGNFRVYTILILSHYWLASILAFSMLRHYFSLNIALFGALSLVYNAYNIKVQTPCHAFTSCWIMGILHPGWLGVLSFGMAVLGGYWPILVVTLPVILLNPTSVWGIFLGLPQILPFLWYWPRSVRAKTRASSAGRMPLHRFFISHTFPTDGFHFPEFAWGIGLVLPIALLSVSVWWIFAIIAFLGTQGMVKIARIPARFLYFLAFSLIMSGNCALESHYSQHLLLGVIILQAIFLWRWRYLYPSFPFSQWWRSPSYYFSKFVQSSKWPYFSGYYFNKHQTWYRGDFRLE